MSSHYQQGCHNLRLYLQEATLPSMPLSRASPPVQQDTPAPPDLFLLSPEPSSSRKLRKILHLVNRVLNKKVQTFTRKQIPCTAIFGGDDTSYDRPSHISLPAASFDIIYALPGEMYDTFTMSAWMDLPLLTLERVMCLVWPEETKGYCTMVQKLAPEHIRPPDADLYRAYFWKKIRDVDHDDINQPVCKLIVAQLVPWALSPKDMDDFMETTQFPAFSIDQGQLNTPSAYNRSHKIWAKLWDDCTCRNCPYFVISVYHGWIFGVFVRGWSMALISDPLKHTDSSPTVLEWLVFWLAAAMELPGAWAPPLLRRFGNPDISKPSNVEEKYSFRGVAHMTQDEMAMHTGWLGKNHKQDTDPNNGKTQEMAGLENTWLTSFNGENP